MVYYDHFGAYIPPSLEKDYYKRGLMSVSSEGFYKAREENIKNINSIFESIKKTQEESRTRIFSPSDIKLDSTPKTKIESPIIIKNLLNRDY